MAGKTLSIRTKAEEPAPERVDEPAETEAAPKKTTTRKAPAKASAAKAATPKPAAPKIRRRLVIRAGLRSRDPGWAEKKSDKQRNSYGKVSQNGHNSACR